MISVFPIATVSLNTTQVQIMTSAPSLFVVSIVLGAAVLHALWNALVKGAGDRVLMLGLVNAGHTLFGAIVVLMFPIPLTESWPFLIASTLIHYFYYGFLLLAYRFGDLSEVYPIARGVAPVLVALGALLFVGEVLPLIAWVGILLVSGGIGLLFLGRNKSNTSRMAIYAALITGFTIACYSVVDGIGVRSSGSPFGYIGWLFFLEGFSTLFFLIYRRNVLRSTSLRFYLTGIVGGMISAIAYGLAIYASSLTTLATVSAIRESSVIIAALIGVVWFGERPWRIRVFAAVVVSIGVFLLATVK